MAERREIAVALIVGEEDDDVGTRRRLARPVSEREAQQRQESERDESPPSHRV